MQNTIIGIDQAQIKNLANKYGLKRLAVFGSFARGEQTENSDIDLLAEWQDGRETFRSYMGVLEEIKSLTGRNIDLTTSDSLHWYLKDKILAEAKDIL